MPVLEKTTQKGILLNTWELLGNPIKNDERAMFSLLDARSALIHNQLPYKSLVKITMVLHIDINKEAPEIFMIPGRTLRRRKEMHRLNVIESLNIFRIAEVIAHALDVLNDLETVSQWFREGNRALGGEQPIKLLNDDIGRELIDEVLGRIKHGIYS